MPGTVSHISSHTVQVIIGVDTHKDQHVAVAIDGRGVRLDEKYVPVAVCGYEELERWSRSLGQIHAFGIEGTGSYGAGLARFLTDRSHTVVEVNRPDRSVRYRKGKSDPTDAEMAARSVLAGVADATPKSGEGEVEMIRMLKSAKDSAIKARTQAVNQMKALVVTAPADLPTRLARKHQSSSRTSRKQPVVHAQVHLTGQLDRRYLRRRRSGQTLHHRVVEPHTRYKQPPERPIDVGFHRRRGKVQDAHVVHIGSLSLPVQHFSRIILANICQLRYKNTYTEWFMGGLSLLKRSASPYLCEAKRLNLLNPRNCSNWTRGRAQENGIEQ